MAFSEYQSLLLGRRQKRLSYWAKQLNGIELADERKFGDVYSTYLLLLSKATKAASEQELDETEERLEDLERELTALFESRRLMTSEIGAPAIKEQS